MKCTWKVELLTQPSLSRFKNTDRFSKRKFCCTTASASVSVYYYCYLLCFVLNCSLWFLSTIPHSMETCYRINGTRQSVSTNRQPCNEYFFLRSHIWDTLMYFGSSDNCTISSRYRSIWNAILIWIWLSISFFGFD